MSSMTWATNLRKISRSSGSHMTSPKFPHPSNVFNPSICGILCLPFALVPSTIPSKKSLSRLRLLSSCLMYLNCLFLIVPRKVLDVFATCSTSWLVRLAVHGTLHILSKNYISAASNLFFLSALND